MLCELIRVGPLSNRADVKRKRQGAPSLYLPQRKGHVWVQQESSHLQGRKGTLTRSRLAGTLA